MNKPLVGVRILDLTHMLAGPYAGMILADLGAETIKVEPLAGEGTRKLLASDPENSLDGMGAYYLTLNRNKKSVAIDLKSDSGMAVFSRLVEASDIVLSNFAAGVPQRLGIDFDTLSQVNPRIITCTVTGYGSDGPRANRQGVWHEMPPRQWSQLLHRRRAAQRRQCWPCQRLPVVGVELHRAHVHCQPEAVD